MSTDFLLDSKIRLWVFLPIVLLTFFVEILRHYAILLFNDKITLLLNEIQDLEMKKRVVVLLKHHSFIPKLAFEIRKGSFHPDSGFAVKHRDAIPQRTVFQPFLLNNQDKLLNLIKQHSSNHLPMILAGAWVSYTFSGFICTKIPFPLTLSFKSMLQRNIELAYLDPSWVSSCSWYFLNVFGLRNSLNMFFEDHLESEFSDYESFVGGVQVCFKEDFNALEMTVHKSALYVL
ncbi:ER membrane protein complex subunit 3 [Dendroctonus ponderosae]|uniref:ER membrane protein complex subunit 3 n=1 Tax=Dendroctonus ponderosae TaxID=77166 RepID=UPI002034C910|nr:ER membrane protein complex subunit 3 [Dendroctonus ponderosae]KAH1012811.1 hypothetical protein HUJ05_011900 [Dendroctonus ponderosae]